MSFIFDKELECSASLKRYKIYATLFAIIFCVILFLVLFTACEREEQENNTQDITNYMLSPAHTIDLLTDFIETAGFRSVVHELEINTRIQELFSQTLGDRIYFAYNEMLGFDIQNPGDLENLKLVINLVGINIDGTGFTRLQLDLDEEFFILAFDITSENTFEFLVSKFISEGGDSEVEFFLLNFDFDGNLQSRTQIEDFLGDLISFNHVNNVILTNDGFVIAKIQDEYNNYIEIFDIHDGMSTKLELKTLHNNQNSMVLTENNRLLVLDSLETDGNEEPLTVIREVDIYTKSFINTYEIYSDINTGVFPAPSGISADLLLATNDFLYSFETESKTQNRMLEWNEVGLVNFNQMSSLIGANSDGEIYILIDGFMINLEGNHLFFLSPLDREELIDRTVITLGGLSISNQIKQAVARFNSINEEYYIETIVYLDLVGGNSINWWENSESIHRAAGDRLRIELSTGQGPDIFFARGYETPFPFLDLYPFIDADPKLSRSDFIPSILTNLENTKGELPFIYPSFTMRATISTLDIVGEIEAWTIDEMLALARRYSHLEFPFGTERIATHVITSQIADNPNFVNWDDFSVNINNEEFISLLYLSQNYFIHENARSIWARMNLEEITSLLSKERLTLGVTFEDIRDFQFVSQVLGDNMIVLGSPPEQGGQSQLNFYSLFGINENSNNPEGAWEFLRSILVEGIYTSVSGGVPIFIEDFENLIVSATTPQYVFDDDGNIRVDDNGNYVENAHFSQVLTNISDDTLENTRITYYEVFSMSENTAEILRDMVFNASSSRFRFVPALSELVASDLDHFYSGARSAEDTARIIQSRVEIFMSEQELLFGGS